MKTKLNLIGNFFGFFAILGVIALFWAIYKEAPFMFKPVGICLPVAILFLTLAMAYCWFRSKAIRNRSVSINL